MRWLMLSGQATGVEAAEHAAVHAGCALALATLLRGTAVLAIGLH